jgi:hypothetical protein
VLLMPSSWNWGAFASLLFIDILFLTLLSVFSRRAQWASLHILSVAAGGALAYGLHAFVETPVAGGSGMLARGGNVLFLAAAIALIAAGAKRSSTFLQRDTQAGISAT